MYCFGYIIQLWTVRFREARRHPMSSSPRSATLIKYCLCKQQDSIIICKRYFFFVFSTQNDCCAWSQAFQMETMETGNKYCYVTEATHVLGRKLRFTAFPEWVCRWILSLESIDYFGTSEHFDGRKKKKNLN